MAVRQLVTPNLNKTARRGYCLQYVDDCVNAPARQPTAAQSYAVEYKNGNVRTNDLPVGVWVPIYFSINSGASKGLGHVAWAYNHGTYVEIHDSETASGARPVYSSIAQVLAWFGAQSPTYLGWTLWIDGVHVAEEYTPAPVTTAPTSGVTPHSGTATVLVNTLNVRAAPTTAAALAGSKTLTKGQTFNYVGFIAANGYIWLQSSLGNYVAEGPNDGNPNNVYVSGGVS